MDQSDAGSAGIILLHFMGPPVPITARMQSTPQTQKARVCSHDGPIRRRKRGYILRTDQSFVRQAGERERGPQRQVRLLRHLLHGRHSSGGDGRGGHLLQPLRRPCGGHRPPGRVHARPRLSRRAGGRRAAR
eukprot:1180672-Prorocentrum_minimum.AAC.3